MTENSENYTIVSYMIIDICSTSNIVHPPPVKEIFEKNVNQNNALKKKDLIKKITALAIEKF